jgi:hypothetical protein
MRHLMLAANRKILRNEPGAMNWLRGGEVSQGRWVCFHGFRLMTWSLQRGLGDLVR